MRMLVVLLTLVPSVALAHTQSYTRAQDVGLGIGGGAGFSSADFESGSDVAGTSGLWYFMVDVPLRDTFYLMPSATLYDLNVGNGKGSSVDLDLSFKLVVPLGLRSIGDSSLGGGVTIGITNAESSHSFHYGAFGCFTIKMVSNMSLFAMVQHKSIINDKVNARITQVNGIAGSIFYF